jgi:hypothetical protein
VTVHRPVKWGKIAERKMREDIRDAFTVVVAKGGTEGDQ